MNGRALRVLLGTSVIFHAAQAHPVLAESSHEAWLRYAPIEKASREKYASLPAAVVMLGDAPLLRTAQTELIRGVKGMLGRTLRAEKELPRESAIVLGMISSIRGVSPGFQSASDLGEDGFWLATQEIRGFPCLIVTATSPREFSTASLRC